MALGLRQPSGGGGGGAGPSAGNTLMEELWWELQQQAGLHIVVCTTDLRQSPADRVRLEMSCYPYYRKDQLMQAQEAMASYALTEEELKVRRTY